MLNCSLKQGSPLQYSSRWIKQMKVAADTSKSRWSEKSQSQDNEHVAMDMTMMENHGRKNGRKPRRNDRKTVTAEESYWAAASLASFFSEPVFLEADLARETVYNATQKLSYRKETAHL